LKNALYVIQNEDGEYQMPWRAALETREHIVLYDSRTDSLPLNEQGIKSFLFLDIEHLFKYHFICLDDIYACVNLLQQHAGGSMTIKIVQGGYQFFSKLYPFLRTQRSLYSPKVKFIL
jgi:serine/threonine/tyrosine-interacting-like protein 1